MTAIKITLLVLAILIAFVLILALFVKKSYTVEREIVINKPRSQVFEYIKYLKNQNSYSKWAMMDPAMKKEFRGTDGTVGFVSAWDSNKKEVGKGEQEIIKITEGHRVDFEIRFIKPFPGVSPAYMITESVSENITTVKWGFKGAPKYPTNLMLLFFNVDKVIGADLKTGLTNLKALLEKE